MKIIKTKEKNDKPGTASALVVIGWLIIVGGFIAGIILGQVEKGYYYSYSEFSIAVAMLYWIIGIIAGTLFIGMGKIIELLSVIANKDYMIIEENENEEQEKNNKIESGKSDNQELDAYVNFEMDIDENESKEV